MENKSDSSFKNVKKNFQIQNQTVEVLQNINLDVKEGEFVSLIGSSGCGKSTLLKMITALEKPTAGEIFIDEEKVVGPSGKCSMIFQEAQLFPWLTAEQNIAFTLPSKASADQEQKTAEKYLQLVGLEAFGKALPSQLSGGMQQRVSIARGLATKPRLLLLDEPFGALDAFTRIDLQEELSSKPGVVKADIEVELPRPRERSSYDFLQSRRNVMKALFEKDGAVREVEYYI